MKLIKLLHLLIKEGRLLKRLTDFNVDIEYTNESERGVSNKSNLGRVPMDEILQSIEEIIDPLLVRVRNILQNCTKRCAILIRDEGAGFDYQLWVGSRNEKIILTINTSIYHPRHLFNPQKTTEVKVDSYGNINENCFYLIVRDFRILSEGIISNSHL